MVVLVPPSTAHATTFTPSQPGGVVFSALAPGANPNITVSFDMPSPSANFSTQAGHLVTFGAGAVATAGDAAIPTGAYIGSLSGVWNLGLANSECTNAVPITFNLVEAATPATTPAVIAPTGPPGNRLANLAVDAGGNGIADGADAYPTFVAEALDPDGPGGPAAPIAPLARYFGDAFVAGTLISIVQLVIMPPGAMAAIPNLEWMTGPWGFPMVVFLENALGPPSNSAVSDSCNVTTSSTSLLGVAADNACTSPAPPPACFVAGGGFVLQSAVSAGCPGDGAPNECGPPACPCSRVTNPAGPSVLTWRQYVVSQRDWDTGAMPFAAAGDGHTNDIDPCPTAVDPALFPPDADADGIWTSCDPAPAVAAADVDGDGWLNRLDNCPLVANPQPAPPPPPAPNAAQYDLDVPVGVVVPDGGPRADGIGPAPGCDPAPLGANGHYHATALAYHVCIGPPVPACAAADADGDGVTNIGDNCVFGANAPPAGFSQSQRDLNADGFSDIFDISLVAGSFGTLGGDPAAAPGYRGRYDLNYDDFNDIFDIALLAGVFGLAC
jgi:hypothetical protein